MKNKVGNGAAGGANLPAVIPEQSTDIAKLIEAQERHAREREATQQALIRGRYRAGFTEGVLVSAAVFCTLGVVAIKDPVVSALMSGGEVPSVALYDPEPIVYSELEPTDEDLLEAIPFPFDDPDQPSSLEDLAEQRALEMRDIEEGLQFTREMEREAMAASSRAPKLSGGDDGSFFSRAATEMGYVPVGEAAEKARPLNAGVEMGPDAVRGIPEFVAADLLKVDGVLIKLQGARPPAADAYCATAEGGAYDCAAWSMKAVQAIAGEAELTCAVSDDLHGAQGALIGWCDIWLAEDVRRDLGDVAVNAGMLVVDESGPSMSPYLRAEKNARDLGYGLWSAEYKNAKNEEEKS